MNTRNYHTALLTVGLVAAAILVVVLALQKQALIERAESLIARIRDPYPGLYLPSVTLESIQGDSVLLGQAPQGHVQVLFVFSTTCEYCRASLPAWKSIASELASQPRVQLYGISVEGADETRSYVSEHRIGFPVVTLTDRKLGALYRTNMLPQSVVIDAEGRVLYARVGAVTPEAADSILHATGGHLAEAQSKDVGSGSRR